MIIYGVALLSVCMLVGMIVGNLIGSSIGVNANVGGVGIAMLLVLVLTGWSRVRVPLSDPTKAGRDGSEARSLWRNDGDVLHRAGLPHGPLSSRSGDQGNIGQLTDCPLWAVSSIGQRNTCSDMRTWSGDDEAGLSPDQSVSG